MKKSTWIGIMALTLLVNNVASGDEQESNTVWNGFSGFFSPDWGKDFSATVGVKVWLNEWRRDSFNSRDIFTGRGTDVLFQNTKPAAQTSELEATPIPQVSLRYKWLILTSSYFAETEFKFEETDRNVTLTFDNVSTQILGATDTASAERREWDVSGGFYVHPNIVILGGYKKIRQDIDFLTVTSGGINNPSFESSSDLTIEGPTIGIAGSVPMRGGLGLYVSYAHGFMDVDVRDSESGALFQNNANFGNRADYDVGELGFTYSYGMQHMAHMPISAATVYAGYRYQAFETFTSGNEDRSDTTRGFVAGVNLSF